MPSEIGDSVEHNRTNDDPATGETLSLDEDEHNKRPRPDGVSSSSEPNGAVTDKKDGPSSVDVDKSDPSIANKRQKCIDTTSNGDIKTEPKPTVADVVTSSVAATKVEPSAPQDPALLVSPGIKTELVVGTNTTNNCDNKAEPPSWSIHDICEQVLGLKGGDRVEVLWDISPEEEEETPASADVAAAKSETRWWGATLLPPDSPVRYYTFDDEEGDEAVDLESVPIRVLDYDPYVEGGFPDKSLNDVAFLS
jgi:hypothetical protein